MANWDWESLGAVERARLGLRMAEERARVAVAVWGAIAGAMDKTPTLWATTLVSLDGHLARRLNKGADWSHILGEPFKIVERYGMYYVGYMAPADLVGPDRWQRFEYLHVGWQKQTTLAEVRRAIGESALDGSGVASAVAFVAIAPRVAAAESALLAAVREYERLDREEFGGRALSVRGLLRGQGMGDVR